MENTKDQIRSKNDFIRKEYEISFMLGTIVHTEGLRAFFTDNNDKADEYLKAIKGFNDFNEGNDPHGEHDFGSFEVAGEKIYFKFDYYKDTERTTGADPYS